MAIKINGEKMKTLRKTKEYAKYCKENKEAIEHRAQYLKTRMQEGEQEYPSKYKKEDVERAVDEILEFLETVKRRVSEVQALLGPEVFELVCDPHHGMAVQDEIYLTSINGYQIYHTSGYHMHRGQNQRDHVYRIDRGSAEVSIRIRHIWSDDIHLAASFCTKTIYVGSIYEEFGSKEQIIETVHPEFLMKFKEFIESGAAMDRLEKEVEWMFSEILFLLAVLYCPNCGTKYDCMTYGLDEGEVMELCHIRLTPPEYPVKSMSCTCHTCDEEVIMYLDHAGNLGKIYNDHNDTWKREVIGS